MPKGYYQSKEKVTNYIQSAKDINSVPLIKKLKKYLPQDSILLELGSDLGTDCKLPKRKHTSQNVQPI